MAFNHILIATDFSACAERATELGVELAEKFDARLTLVHSWDVSSYSYGADLYLPGDLATPIEKAAATELARAIEALKRRYPRADAILRTGEPWQEIVAVATEIHADLIILGTHGRRGLSRALIGSVAEKVVRMATQPVLTVHSPGDPSSSG